jgi:hypothetical protein
VGGGDSNRAGHKPARPNPASRSEARNRPTDRFDDQVAGFHWWSAPRKRANSSATDQRAPAKYNALLSTAKRSTRSHRYASAVSASPCMVKERWILRPVCGSLATTTRISHAPARRSRIDPEPRRARARPSLFLGAIKYHRLLSLRVTSG